MPLLDKSAFADPTLPIPSWAGVKSAVRGLMGAVTPPDPYEEAGRMVQQARGGDYLGALETGIGAMPNTGAIKAYHGSPHDFDRFDMSKIGTGEGAQAYGHGLYFADNEAVARSYRDALSNTIDRATIAINGKPVTPSSSAEQRAYSILAKDGPSSVRQVLKSMKSEGMAAPEDIAAYENVLKASKGQKVEIVPQGHMYEVNINAEPEHFLDWDKPLSEQSQSIRDLAASQMGLWTSDSPARQAYVKGKLSSPGRQLHGMLTGEHGQEAASQRLRGAGIPGIKYLDQGSRGAGEGSRNYVVFDDKLVDIARKYGLLPLGMGGFDFSQNEQK